MDPWFKVTTPRPEVRQGRSFNPDEFAIALEQVAAGTAPLDYRDAEQFFKRTVFTTALKEHLGLVLRRLAGKTDNTAPVLALVTQFGGGKTHTLAALYHLAKNPAVSAKNPDVKTLLDKEGLSMPRVRVAVLVGNAWDPEPGRETPWLDIARQLAGDEGARIVGDKPPGTDKLRRLFDAAGGKVLILFDETLNLVNRHRDLAENFYAFFDNLNRAVTGKEGCAVVVSLPRSQVEMTDFDLKWQERVLKVLHRVSKDIIVNNESDIAEVVRRRLFEDFDAKTKARIKEAASDYAEWCFQRRAQLPPEWTAVDTASTDAKAKEQLQKRFEACYPFHPATLSVFQRKWQTLPQYQQTRGTLAMLAQWVAWTYREGYEQAREEAFISLGTAPLQNQSFRAAVLSQLGEPRLIAAIETDIAGEMSHARALDADAKGKLKDLHRRVATAIFFESSGGMTGEKAAHVPELRFALGEPGMDTTSIDNAATTLETRAFFLRKVGKDGYRFGFKPTLRKVVGDRRAALDDNEAKRAEREAVKREFEKEASVKFAFFPQDASEVPDAPKLTLVVMDTDQAYTEERKKQLAVWAKERTPTNRRLYPAALVWCLKKEGMDLREKVELWLAWKRVAGEINSGVLGSDFEPEERREVDRNLRDAAEAMKEEVWAAYRFVLTHDARAQDGLHVIDLGAGHSSAGESLAGRVLAALRSEGRLSESVGAGYLERNWPPPLKESGAWPLAGLRQAFLDGSLTRLADPETVLRAAIPRLVERGEFGLASGQRPDGFDRLWWKELVPSEEVVFDQGTFLLTKARAQALTTTMPAPQAVDRGFGSLKPQVIPPSPEPQAEVRVEVPGPDVVAVYSLQGQLPPEFWNKLAHKLIPTLKKGQGLVLTLNVAVETPVADREHFERELRRALAELSLSGWSLQVKEEKRKA